MSKVKSWERNIEKLTFERDVLQNRVNFLEDWIVKNDEENLGCKKN